MLVDLIGYGNFPAITALYNSSYHLIDKYLDMYYLSFEFFLSLHWKELLARKTSIILFVWRVIGFALFEITKMRSFLFFALNLFENFYLFVAFMQRYYPKWKLKGKKQLFLLLFILYIPKFGQEYLLHMKEAQPWTWFRSKFL